MCLENLTLRIGYECIFGTCVDMKIGLFENFAVIGRCTAPGLSSMCVVRVEKHNLSYNSKHSGLGDCFIWGQFSSVLPETERRCGRVGCLYLGTEEATSVHHLGAAW